MNCTVGRWQIRRKRDKRTAYDQMRMRVAKQNEVNGRCSVSETSSGDRGHAPGRETENRKRAR